METVEQFHPFIEAYSFTKLLAPNEKKKDNKKGIGSGGGNCALGTAAKRRMVGKPGSELQSAGAWPETPREQTSKLPEQGQPPGS